MTTTFGTRLVPVIATLLVLPVTAHAQFAGAHTQCDSCHGTIGPDDDPTQGTAEEVELLCLSCHGPGGISLYEAAVHDTRGGTQTCRDCHEPHYYPDNHLGGVNLKYVGFIDYATWPRLAVINTPNSGARDVVFESRGPDYGTSTLHSFADSDEDGNGIFDGVCEVCHTSTAHHTNSAPDTSHFTGQTCTSCHPHDQGFAPQGGGDCTTCHSTARGPRRAVVGEFPVTDPHAHFGGELDSADCVVCHDQGTHQDGYVDLIDPDDGGLYRFIVAEDLTNDPDLSNFCLNCHDADGAARLAAPLDPFADGNSPPDVATSFMGTLQWYEEYGDVCFGTEGTLRAVNSHHDVLEVDQVFSGAKVECLNCHGAHNAGASQPVADPFDTSQAWSGTENDFCLTCHSGGTGPSDPALPPGVTGPTVAMRGIDSCGYTEAPWYVDYRWLNTAHGPDSKRAWEGYSGAPMHELRCLDCHDQHGSYSPVNPAGNPYMIRDYVDGTMYVDDGVRPNAQWTGPPWNTFGTAREVVIGINGIAVDWGGPTGLCSVCHADWIAAYDWHTFCDGCQTCHGHGQAFGNADWGTDPPDDTPCPPPPPAPDSLLKIFESVGTPLHQAEPDRVIPPDMLPGALPDNHDGAGEGGGR